jgi:Tfp pilus assembly protein PilW
MTKLPSARHSMRKGSRRRGATLVELVATFVILAFISLGTLQLYRVGDKTQRTARFYGDAQAKAREALQRISRTLRHAWSVEIASTQTNFSAAPNSDTTQSIVKVPQPYPGTSYDYIRVYLSGGTIYAQRQDDVGAGLALATGVTSLTFTYYLTAMTSTGTSVSQVNGTPATATDVEIAITLTSGTVTTTETAYVSLRNKNLGF